MRQSLARISGGPPRVGFLRRAFGTVGARMLGWGDGFRGTIARGQHEIDKFKERGELGGRHASGWWAAVSGELTGECDALGARIQDAETRQRRLEAEISTARVRVDETHDSHDEVRLRALESELDQARRQQRELTDRLKRADAERSSAYEMARNSAEEFKDYYEALMRAYCAGNRKVTELIDRLPVIELPEPLRGPSVEATPVANPAAG